MEIIDMIIPQMLSFERNLRHHLGLMPLHFSRIQLLLTFVLRNYWVKKGKGSLITSKGRRGVATGFYAHHFSVSTGLHDGALISSPSPLYLRRP